jgi:hypothetical protein
MEDRPKKLPVAPDECSLVSCTFRDRDSTWRWSLFAESKIHPRCWQTIRKYGPDSRVNKSCYARSVYIPDVWDSQEPRNGRAP